MRRITLLMLLLYGCVPPPPHQFVPGGPLGEAGQTVQGPRQASDEEVRAMLAESSRHQHDPAERVDLNGRKPSVIRQCGGYETRPESDRERSPT